MVQLFSLIIPAYNSEKYISECLRSILKQKISRKKYEIIIVNDASKDKTLKICKKFERNTKNIKIYNNNRNLGVSLSRNIGIKKAKGEYIIFLDSDDQLKKNSLQNIESILSYSKTDLLISLNMENKLKNIYFNNLKYKNNFYYSYDKNLIFKFLNSYTDYSAHSWNFIINKNFLLKNKIYFDNIRVFEDQVFTTKALFFAKNLKFNQKSFHNHIERPNSLGRSMKFNTLMSTLLVVKNIGKILENMHLNQEQKKFLYKRIKFVLKFFKLHLLLANKKESKKAFIYFQKNLKNLFQFDKNLNKENLLLFKRKNIYRIKKFNYKKFTKIFIYGVGVFGRVIFQVLKTEKINIEAFLDNNSHFNNKKCYGIKIINFNKKTQKYIKKLINPLIIVSHQDIKAIKKINNDLRKYGLKRSNIRVMNWSTIL